MEFRYKPKKNFIKPTSSGHEEDQDDEGPEKKKVEDPKTEGTFKQASNTSNDQQLTTRT